MRRLKTHTIQGKRYNIISDEVVEGYVDIPGMPLQLYVAYNLSPKKELETVIHEFTHAYRGRHVPEKWVNDFGHEMARLLWRWGYRKKI